MLVEAFLAVNFLYLNIVVSWYFWSLNHCFDVESMEAEVVESACVFGLLRSRNCLIRIMISVLMPFFCMHDINFIILTCIIL